MAKQKGIIKLRGTVSGITFYKTADGYLARERSSIDARRIAKDPVFQRTRENAAEFGTCARSGALLIRTFRGILRKNVDGRVNSRITKAFFKVIQSDLTSARGSRNVLTGALGFLRGFEFNNRSSLAGTVFTSISVDADRTAGTLTVGIGSFIPYDLLVAPSGATHYQLLSAGAAIDFLDRTFVVAQSETVPAVWNSVASLPVTHVNVIPVNSLLPFFVVVGVVFYQEVGGVLYALNEGKHNPFSIVYVEAGI